MQLPELSPEEVQNILDVNTSPNEDISLQEIETIHDFAKQKVSFDKAPEEKWHQKSTTEGAVDNAIAMAPSIKSESKKQQNVASTIDRTLPHQSTTFTGQTASVSTSWGGQGRSPQEAASGSAEARKSKIYDFKIWFSALMSALANSITDKHDKILEMGTW